MTARSLCINGSLHRWFPRRALRSGELAVIVLMTLVACSLPNWGLMRFFIPTPVAPFHVGAGDRENVPPFCVTRWKFLPIVASRAC